MSLKMRLANASREVCVSSNAFLVELVSQKVMVPPWMFRMLGIACRSLK